MATAERPIKMYECRDILKISLALPCIKTIAQAKKTITIVRKMVAEGLELKTASKGVVLRQFSPRDAHPLFALISSNRKHLSQFGDQTARKYPAYLSVWLSIITPEQSEKMRLGIWVGQHLAGTVNLLPKADGNAELGYWIGKEFCGQGLATIATTTLTRYAHKELGHKFVTAHVHKDNLASLRVLEKSGFATVIQIGDTMELCHPASL